MSGFEINEKTGIERTLQLREHIDWPQVIRHQIILTQGEFRNLDPQKIHSMIMALQAQMPTSWHDKEFREDIKNSEEELTIDIRPECCGVKLDTDYCIAQGIPTHAKHKVVNPIKRLHALIDLLDRKGYTSRKQYVEESLGIPFDQFLKEMEARHVLDESETDNPEK